MVNNNRAKILIIFLTAFYTFSCAKVDPVTGEKILIEPNPEKRAKAEADRGGGIFGDINNKKSSSTNYEFATSNVLWRATLKSLDFLPLVNADYSGGVIIYDWYSDKNDSKDQIKITVKFLSNELRADSIEITAHKKVCENIEKCITKKMDNQFSNNIKDLIITSARSLKIEESKKEKK
jgi:hypothetical protein